MFRRKEIMFGIFKKDAKKQLEKKRKKLLEQAFQLSHTDRTKSDALMARAEAVLKEVEKLDNMAMSCKGFLYHGRLQEFVT